MKATAQRRTPPKQRGQERRRTRVVQQQQPHRQDDQSGRSAPGHMGGQFDEAGYGSGQGAFGFVQHALP